MGSLEKLVEKIVQIKTVECQNCHTRITVPKRRGKYCKTVKCPSCGRREKTTSPFTKQYVETVTVKSPVKPIRHLKPVLPKKLR